MKRLTLVRHANAEWNAANVVDFERPLSRKGMTEATSMARRLSDQQLVPDLLLTSTAVRTVQTAEIFASVLKLPARTVKQDERLYLARPEDILRVVRETGSLTQHLLLIGHNPGISQLVRQLTAEHDRQDLATASLCSMTFNLDGWETLNGSAIEDVRYDSPRKRFTLWA